MGKFQKYFISEKLIYKKNSNNNNNKNYQTEIASSKCAQWNNH